MYREKLEKAIKHLYKAQERIEEIVTEHNFGEEEILTSTYNLDDATLFIHRAREAMVKAKRDFKKS